VVKERKLSDLTTMQSEIKICKADFLQTDFYILSLIIFFFFLHSERTEKIPMGSIKNVISEPIEDHDEYHMMVREFHCKFSVKAFLKRLSRSFLSRTVV